MDRDRRAFVAGATGYTGRAVVEALRRHGVATVAHVRPDSPRLGTWVERLDALGAQVDTSAWTPAAMTAALERWRPTLVFALLGTTARRARHEAGASYESVDYGLTHVLLEASRAVVPGALFVYLSAMGARPGTRNRYLAARVRIEEELRAGGMRTLVARPAFISGSGRGERRVAERVASTAIDAALDVVRLLGGGRLHDRYSAMTGGVLGAGLVHLALAGRTGTVGPTLLRRVGQ